MKNLLFPCLMAGAGLVLYGCDSNATLTSSESDTQESVSKRGGNPGHGGGGGTVADYNETFGDGVHDGLTSATQAVQISADNKKRIETTSAAYKITINFASTVAQSVEEVGARTRDEILSDGLCSYKCPDGYTCDGTLARLQGALLNTVDTDSHEVRVIVDKTAALENGASSYNFISLRDMHNGGDAAAGHPHLDLGRNEFPANFLKSDFLGAAGDISNGDILREFVFSDGTVQVWERQDVNATADLFCNNLDEVYVSIDPVSP